MPHVARFDRFAPLALGPDQRVFVLTGAGISAESGIRTFRDADGLWEQYRVEEVASPEGWARDAEVVWRFYSQRREQAVGCRPNPAHVALAKLEEVLGDRLFLCTQNVDPLHERGGSRNVHHMHGELLRSRCERCDAPDFADERTCFSAAVIPRCACGGRIRPHIVWFGEMPIALDRIGEALDRCDVFVTIGSSGVVYPAAGFVRHVRGRKGVRTVYVGPEEPDNASSFDECRLGKAGEVVPGLFAMERA
jgi:NAD-dependent deacetylase